MHMLVAFVATLSAFLAQCAWGAQPPSTPRSVAFVGVNVLPMTGERVIENATVLVVDGVIAAIGVDGSVAAPRDAHRIEAKGRYLIPGLAEMHAHVPGSSATRTYRDDVLFLYAANGVTLARGMLGAPEHLQLRGDLAAHRLLGPRLYTSGPSINGNSAKTPDAAARMVREQKAAGYDFIKLHPGLSRDTFLAMAQAAHEVGIDFAGHVSTDVGLALSLERGQKTIDHLDGYMQVLVPEDARQQPNSDDMFGFPLAAHVEPQRFGDAVRMTRAAGTWNAPTQTLLDNFVGELSAEALEQRPEMRYVPVNLRAQYRKAKSSLAAQAPPAQAEAFLEARRKLIKALHDGGARLLLGSDAPQVYNVPGFSAHRELQALVRAGLSPYEALQIGTAAPAEFFGESGRYGTIVVGAEADLILLRANPLQDIANTQQIEGVMVRGRWLDRAFLDRELAGVEARAKE